MIVDSSDGVRVAVHLLGGSGPKLLISHATGLHGRAYLPLATLLAEHYEVHALDYRGHGATPAPENRRFAWAAMVDDLLAVIDALGGGPLPVVGHSMGGAVALAAELRRPGSVRAAYVFEPIVIPTARPRPEANPMAATARRRREIFPSKAAALYRYASRPPLAEMRADSLYAYVEHGFDDLPDGTVRLSCRAEDEAATFDGAGVITTDDVHALTIPVTIGVGHVGSEYEPAGFAAHIAESMPNATLARYPLLGHFAPLQDPPTIAAAIVTAFGTGD